MITVKPRREIIEYVEDVLQSVNLGKRGKYDGDKTAQRSGLLGEVVVKDLLGVPWIKNLDGFDGGFDIEINGIKADVKTKGVGYKFQPWYDHIVNGYQIFLKLMFIFLQATPRQPTKLMFGDGCLSLRF